MRRMVVVGLVGGAVVVTAVVLARRSVSPQLEGEPDWAPLTLAGPDLTRATEPAKPQVAAPQTAAAAPVPTPEPVLPEPLEPDVGGSGEKWVAADETGGCPESHPVKASNASRIFHVPGGHFYARTKASRCYCDTTAAEADGYRAAKR